MTLESISSAAVPVASKPGALPRKGSLDVFFEPKSVAIIGATERERTVGRTLVHNILSGPFGAKLYPINPKRDTVLGVRSFPSISSAPSPIDLAVIATPAPTVPGVIRECGQAGVRGAIVISAGFKETGPEGESLERMVLEEAQSAGIRIVGPNCLGVMSPLSGLNASFAATMAKPGNVGFISQSGALCTAILDWSLKEQVGFSAFVSVGSMLDVGWGDLIDYLGHDPRTQSILIYMESIGDARKFLSAAREAALSKPIIVLKAGRTEAGSKAAASHTGALTGSDEVLDAAFHRCGVLRANSMSELFNMAEVLSKQPRPAGPRLAILTNAGGPGVLAADALVADGGVLAPLSQETVSELDGILPAAWSHGNPVDVLGDADADRYARALEIVAKDPNADGLLLLLTPQAMTDPTQTAERLKPYAKIGKPVLANWMGGPSVAAGDEILAFAGISSFSFPDTAARVFNSMWRYSQNLKSLYETPLDLEDEDRQTRAGRAKKIIDAALNAGRTLLTEPESKQVLSQYGIPTVTTVIASNAHSAAQAAQEIGYPVALKLYSETVTHKSDVGGVQLNLNDEQAVRQAFEAIRNSVSEKVGLEHFQGVTVQPMVRLKGLEVILGSSIDPQFGPVLLFGTGGKLVEVYKDRALALPPLTTTLARLMMEQTHMYTALQGVRGESAVDQEALEQLVVRFSELVVEQKWIKEIDINPLLASGDTLVALDARIVLFPSDTRPEALPKPAIRPYPMKYVSTASMNDGAPMLIRPIRPEDEVMMRAFHAELSAESVFSRYMHSMSLAGRIAHDRLSRVCFIDYDREMRLVAEITDPETGIRSIIGVATAAATREPGVVEMALSVIDRFQNQGVGTVLLEQLVEIARKEKARKMVAEMLPENHRMINLCKSMGFEVHMDREEGLVMGRLPLVPS